MSESIWTTTPPTVPGWYWACWDWEWRKNEPPIIVEVMIVGNRLVARHSNDLATLDSTYMWNARLRNQWTHDVEHRLAELDDFSLWSDGPIFLPKFRLFDTSAPPVV